MLPEGQFKIHPLLNYIVFRIAGAASGMVSRKMTLGQLVLQRSAFQGSFSEGVPVKWPRGNSFCRVPRSGGAAALEGGWVRKRRSAQNTTIVNEGSGLKASVPPTMFMQKLVQIKHNRPRMQAYKDTSVQGQSDIRGFGPTCYTGPPHFRTRAEEGASVDRAEPIGLRVSDK